MKTHHLLLLAQFWIAISIISPSLVGAIISCILSAYWHIAYIFAVVKPEPNGTQTEYVPESEESST